MSAAAARDASPAPEHAMSHDSDEPFLRLPRPTELKSFDIDNLHGEKALERILKVRALGWSWGGWVPTPTACTFGWGLDLFRPSGTSVDAKQALLSNDLMPTLWCRTFAALTAPSPCRASRCGRRAGLAGSPRLCWRPFPTPRVYSQVATSRAKLMCRCRSCRRSSWTPPSCMPRWV